MIRKSYQSHGQQFCTYLGSQNKFFLMVPIVSCINISLCQQTVFKKGSQQATHN